MRLHASLSSSLLFCLATFSSGQDSLSSRFGLDLGNLPVLTDKAPPPSDRFPASWYPGPSDETFRLSVVSDAPYTATLVTTYRSQSGSEVITQTIRTIQARDSQGRTHTESETGQATTRQGEEVKLRTISVFDPVSHCEFTWTEPDYGAKLVAIVKCLPRTIRYTNLDYSQIMWAIALHPEAVQDGLPKGSSASSESLGKRMFGDIEAEGRRTIATNAMPNGESRTSAREIWYSPYLKELVQFGDVDLSSSQTDAAPDMQLTNIKRTEPDPSLFYPPQGYEIQPQFR